MYQFSRAIYRELAPHLDASRPMVIQLTQRTGSSQAPSSSQTQLLHKCEAAIERLATDRYYFARPARTLFCDIRGYFPMSAQERVHAVVTYYMSLAQQYMEENPLAAYAAVSGKPLQCRATTRKGAACQRTPLPHNGYCPSHQHLADTEDSERLAA